MLGVELKLVDLHRGKQVDKLKQRRDGGDFVAADVEHDAAHGEVRPIFDVQTGQVNRKLAEQLNECLRRVERKLGTAGADVDFVRSNIDRVLLSIVLETDDGNVDYVVDTRTACGEKPVRRKITFRRGLNDPRGGKQIGRHVGVELDELSPGDR